MSACSEIFDTTNNSFSLEIYFATIEIIISSVFLTTAVYDCDTFKVLDNAVSHIHTHSQVTVYSATDSVAPHIVLLSAKWCINNASLVELAYCTFRKPHALKYSPK